MALTIAGAHVAIGPLLSGCYSIIQGINKLQQSYKFMHVTLTSIVLTCSITRVALKGLDSILEKQPGSIASFEKELFEGVKVASTAILSMLENHVSELLDVAAGDVLLRAQKTSKKKVLLALYNESDMKELLSKLKEQNALLDTVLSFVQSDKQEQLSDNQDQMMKMMATQDKTLQNMLRAQRLFQEHLRDNDSFTASDMVSNLSSASTGTTMTAFEFDSVIKATAVYQRCMRRRGDATSLLSLGLSMEPIWSSGEDDTATTHQWDPAPRPSHRESITEESLELDKDLLGAHLGGSAPPQQDSVSSSGLSMDHLHAQSPSISSDAEFRPVDDESSLRDTSPEDRSEQVAEAFSRGRRIRPFGANHVSAAADKTWHQENYDHARSQSHERIKQKVIEKLMQRQRETPEEYGSGKMVPLGPIHNYKAESAERREYSDNVIYDHRDPIKHLTISSRNVLATASWNMIQLRNLDTGEEVVKIICYPCGRKDICPIFSSDGAFLCAPHFPRNGKMTTMSVWNAETGARLCTLRQRSARNPRITALTICSNGTLVACAEWVYDLPTEYNCVVWLFETATGRPRGNFRLWYQVQALSFIQGDKELLCCFASRVEVWDVATCTRIRVLKHRGLGCERPIVTQDSKLICVNEDVGISIFDLKLGLRKARATLRQGKIVQLAYSTGTGEIAFACQNGLVGTWNSSTGVVRKSPRKFDLDAEHWCRIAIAPDGQTVFYGGVSGRVRCWNLGP